MSNIVTPKAGEEVLLTLRKSFFTLRKQIFRFLLIILPGVLLLIFTNNEYLVTLAIVILFFAATYAFYNFIIWFYDVYIITNQRVIVVAQKSMFTREFIEAEAGSITDVRYKIVGVFATLFQFGTVTIHTSTGQDMELTDLSDPNEVQEMIKALAEATRKHHDKDKMSADEFLGKFFEGYKKQVENTPKSQ